MKQSEPSRSPHYREKASSQEQEQKPTPSFHAFLFRRRVKSILVFLCLAAAVTVYVLAHKSLSHQPDEIEAFPSSAGRSLEIEVLDGAGNMRAAQQFTNILRARGYDVVEMRKSGGGIVDRTYILDRSGDLAAAQKLAATLGVPVDNVFQKIDRTLYLDATVIVGRDFSRLKSYQVSTERTNH